jgi:hypothetical protein
MKRPFLLLASVLIFNASFAQTKWIIVTGTSYSSFNTDLMGAYGFEVFRDDYINSGGSASSPATNSIKVNGYFGIEADFKLSEKGFLKTGLKYVSVGDSYFFKTKDIQYQDGNGTKTDAKFIMRPRLDYLAIPLNYGIQTTETISIYAGITPHFNVGNIFRTNRFTGNARDVDEKWDKTNNPIDARRMVLFANVGATFYLSDRLVFDSRVYRSLASVYDDPEFQVPFNEAKIWNVELGIGFKL